MFLPDEFEPPTSLTGTSATGEVPPRTARAGTQRTRSPRLDDDVIGCVYIFPDDGGARDAHVRSWVRADRAELDAVLRTTVAEWLQATWPFAVIRYEDVGL